MRGHPGPGMGIRDLDLSDDWLTYTNYSDQSCRLLEVNGERHLAFIFDMEGGLHLKVGWS